MKKNLLYIFLIILSACQTTDSKIAENKPPADAAPATEKTAHVHGADSAKNWLITSIENYFKNGNDKMETLTTKRYAEYKSDAMNIEFDVHGNLTQEQFDKKWNKLYDTKLAGYHSAFLISAQDWVNIQVTNCDLISEDQNRFVFKVTLKDEAFKATYLRDIKVITENGGYKIDDVIELN